MTIDNPPPSNKNHQSKVAKKPGTGAIVTVVLVFICMLFALVVTLRGQMNRGYVQERYPVEELETRLKQKRQPLHKQ